MAKWKAPLFFLIVIGLLAFSITTGKQVKLSWSLLAAGIVGVAIIFLYWDFEQSPVSPREISVIAVLGAVAALARVSLAALPNIQPVTFLVIVSGYVFGARTGFMVGSTAALASNFFLGQGPWTPWQMFAWGLAGASAAYFRAAVPNAGKWVLALFQFAWGYLFGCIMNVWTWTAFIYPLSWQSFLATWATSLWFDSLHALSNVFFYLIFGGGVIKILNRVKKKIEVSRLPVQDVPASNNHKLLLYKTITYSSIKGLPR
ncbi:MAG: ECF transporter S component [Desulfotomaculaceae bacterium]|nr:ECF transporter S component [Desulfotomaculaceae bacterium]